MLFSSPPVFNYSWPQQMRQAANDHPERATKAPPTACPPPGAARFNNVEMAFPDPRLNEYSRPLTRLFYSLLLLLLSWHLPTVIVPVLGTKEPTNHSPVRLTLVDRLWGELDVEIYIRNTTSRLVVPFSTVRRIQVL